MLIFDSYDSLLAVWYVEGKAGEVDFLGGHFDCIESPNPYHCEVVFDQTEGIPISGLMSGLQFVMV